MDFSDFLQLNTPPRNDRSTTLAPSVLEFSIDYPAPARPDNLDESSIADPVPVDISTGAHVVTYQIVEDTSIRGKDKLFDSVGYSYTVKRRNGQSTTWRCSQRSKAINCGATVRQVGDLYLPGPRDHIHPPVPGSDTAAAIVHVSKVIAQENPFKSAGDIINELIREHVPADEPLPALPTVDTMQHNANYHRRKQRPKHPRDLDFDIQDEHVADDFMRRDLRVDGERHLIFATDTQLSLLSQAKTWYIDATFHIVQRPFYQLFTINVFVRQEDSLKQLPMIQVVMSRRRKQDYSAVLQAVKDLLPQAPRGHSRAEISILNWGRGLPRPGPRSLGRGLRGPTSPYTE